MFSTLDAKYFAGYSNTAMQHCLISLLFITVHAFSIPVSNSTRDAAAGDENLNLNLKQPTGEEFHLFAAAIDDVAVGDLRESDPNTEGNANFLLNWAVASKETEKVDNLLSREALVRVDAATSAEDSNPLIAAVYSYDDDLFDSQLEPLMSSIPCSGTFTGHGTVRINRISSIADAALACQLFQSECNKSVVRVVDLGSDTYYTCEHDDAGNCTRATPC